MAYKRNYKSNRRKRKYTEAEKIAFRLGQEQRVKKSINTPNNRDTRVYDAFCKGLNGKPTSNKKPLF